MDQRVRLYISPHQVPSSHVYREEFIVKYHLNDTFIVQWITWLREVGKGNLGYSYLTGTSVIESIRLSFAATLEIVMYSAIITVFVGYKIGVLSAKRAYTKAPRGDAVDKIIRVASTIGYSTPAFILGLFLLLIFSTCFDLPFMGRLGPEANAFVHSRAREFTNYTGLYTIDALLNGQLWILFDALQHLALPILTLTVTMLPIIVRITRTSMIGELAKPYLIAARAKGLNEKQVINHAKKSSLFPILTVSGMIIANILTGVVVVEYTFNTHGLGYWLLKAIARWDYALIVGISLFSCVVFIIANVIVDLAYTYLDPRVKP